MNTKAEDEKVYYLMSKGHSHHCAFRQVWGDGECECDLYAKGYDPYVWMKGKIPFIKNLKNLRGLK